MMRRDEVGSARVTAGWTGVQRARCGRSLRAPKHAAPQRDNVLRGRATRCEFDTAVRTHRRSLRPKGWLRRVARLCGLPESQHRGGCPTLAGRTIEQARSQHSRAAPPRVDEPACSTPRSARSHDSTALRSCSRCMLQLVRGHQCLLDSNRNPGRGHRVDRCGLFGEGGARVLESGASQDSDPSVTAPGRTCAIRHRVASGGRVSTCTMMITYESSTAAAAHGCAGAIRRLGVVSSDVWLDRRVPEACRVHQRRRRCIARHGASHNMRN